MKTTTQTSRLLVVLVVLVFLLLVYFMCVNHQSYQRVDLKPPSQSGRSFQYGVMFDAGSTGTRVHVFKFLINHGASPKLDKETFRSIKPGLSAYAEEPDKCSSGILELLAVAKSSVPSSHWSNTPVVLRATAGLRLLPGDKAVQLLDTVRALFLDSPFLCREDSVSIMDGTDEGISAWITINFLTGSLYGPHSATVGTLDLGGGSTQITFSTHHQVSPIDFIKSFQMFNNTYTVYTHSYLGLGLMSARLSVLRGDDAAPLGVSSELVSVCLAPEYIGQWQHAEVVYTVRGQRAEEPVFQACRSKVLHFLDGKVTSAPQQADAPFYAFSYYYDRALDLTLIDAQHGGTIMVSDYMDSAQRVCGAMQSVGSHNPFLCLDLVYMSVLLQQLGFSPQHQLKLARTIDQVETSWALGATFHYIQTLKNP